MDVVKRNNFIDILRSIAIFGTIYQHTLFQYTKPTELNVDVWGYKFYYFIFSNGWLGVNLFFILSGIVLFRQRIIDNFDSVVLYYKSRFYRLVPILLIYMFFINVLVERQFHDFLFNLLIIPTGVFSLIPKYWAPKENYVLWSVGVEILFSLILPLIVFSITTWGFKRVFVSIVCFCFAYRVVSDYYWFHYINPFHGNLLINPLKDNIFGRLDDFLVGMYIANLANNKRKFGKVTVTLSVLALFIDMYLWNYIYCTPRTFGMSVAASFAHIGFSFPFCFIIASLIYNPLWSRKIFAGFVFTGQICYSMYINHTIILIYIFTQKLVLESYLQYVATVYVVSTMMFIFLELPWINRKPRWALWLLPAYASSR
jgi:peptidoglycan/LPS O-acetylase OafA/YrhL